jgi:hypothetical protein
MWVAASPDDVRCGVCRDAPAIEPVVEYVYRVVGPPGVTRPGVAGRHGAGLTRSTVRTVWRR